MQSVSNTLRQLFQPLFRDAYLVGFPDTIHLLLPYHELGTLPHCHSQISRLAISGKYPFIYGKGQFLAMRTTLLGILLPI